jgi:hypothetical protein
MKVETYDLTAASGHHIRKATQVRLPDGRVVRFIERVPRREAIRYVQDSIRLGQLDRLAQSI